MALFLTTGFHENKQLLNYMDTKFIFLSNGQKGRKRGIEIGDMILFLYEQWMRFF